jgi:hypothetical protein
MAKKTVCDVCDRPIADGSNVGVRNPIFSHAFPGGVSVEVQTTSRVNGNSGADLCLPCLKKAVADA